MDQARLDRLQAVHLPRLDLDLHHLEDGCQNTNNNNNNNNKKVTDIVDGKGFRQEPKRFTSIKKRELEIMLNLVYW